MTRRTAAPADDASVRQRLLAASVDLFTRKGYAATTVREIVEAAGVTKPVLYYYFASKEGLFRALMRGAIDQYEAVLERSLSEGGSPRERIEALCLEAFRLFKENVALVRVLNSVYYGPPQGAPPIDIDQMHHRFQDRLRRLLAEGRRVGLFHFEKTEDAMWAVIGALNVATEVELCHPEMALGPRDLRRVLAIVFAGLATASEGAAPRVVRKRRGVQP